MVAAHHHAADLDVSRRDAGLLARSVSRPLWKRLQERPFAAQVHAVFEQTCYLATTDGALVALVLAQIGDGPLNIVLDGTPGAFAAMQLGMPIWLEGSWLRVAGLEITLEGAAIWEPCPPWSRLRANAVTITDQLPLLHAVALHLAPEGSLLALLPSHTAAIPGGLYACGRSDVTHSLGVSQGDLLPAVSATARTGAETLQAGWLADPGQWRAGADQLAGLGGGLTPAGDDFLMGAMLSAWLAHPNPRQICRIIAEAAIPRTTGLSAAFLRTAARGECSAPWHRLLEALQDSGNSALVEAARDVLAHGSTSGADTLAGFLWMGLKRGSSYPLTN